MSGGRCIGVLGGGSIGTRHASNLRALGIAEIVVFEPNEEARRRIPAALAPSVVGTEAELWDRAPGAVLVCTPSAQHLEQALGAVSRGCDVFVEKPLASTVEGCAELIHEAGRRQCVSMVACNMRFHPGPATVRRLLDEGRIGRMLGARIYCGSYLPSWRPWQDYRQSYSAHPDTGGAILDGIHEIDLALWLLGPATLRAAASRSASSIDLDRTVGLAEILLDHESGVLSSTHLNFVQRDYSRGCELIGERGTIRWDFNSPVVTIRGGATEEEAFPLPAGWMVNDMYLDELRHFLASSESRSPSCNPFEGGLAALEIACAAHRSLAA